MNVLDMKNYEIMNNFDNLIGDLSKELGIEINSYKFGTYSLSEGEVIQTFILENVDLSIRKEYLMENLDSYFKDIIGKKVS